MTKLTYAKALDVAINAVAENEEVVAKLTALKASIEKKNASKGEKKPTATQKANEVIKEQIVTVLADAEKALTVTEIVKALDGDFTNQKISALVRQLIDAGKVEKFEEKRRSYFKLA